MQSMIWTLSKVFTRWTPAGSIHLIQGHVRLRMHGDANQVDSI